MLMPLSKVPTTNGQAHVKAVSGQADSVKQTRALRKLLRDLITFAGATANDLAATLRKAPQRKRQRLLYRRADTLSDDAVERIVSEIGVDRFWRAVDMLTQPQPPLVAAEGRPL
jgi:hypothetical protein